MQKIENMKVCEKCGEVYENSCSCNDPKEEKKYKAGDEVVWFGRQTEHQQEERLASILDIHPDNDKALIQFDDNKSTRLVTFYRICLRSEG